MMEVKHVTNMTMNFCSEELWFCRDYWDLSSVTLRRIMETGHTTQTTTDHNKNMFTWPHENNVVISQMYFYLLLFFSCCIDDLQLSTDSMYILFYTTGWLIFFTIKQECCVFIWLGRCYFVLISDHLFTLLLFPHKPHT